MGETVFGKILSGEIEANIVHQDEQVVAFRDISPQAPTHILIIPRKEIETIDDVEDDDEALLGHMILVATEVARGEGIAEKGYRLVINCRGEGGQEVYHLHMHLLGGRPMKWPPG